MTPTRWILLATVVLLLAGGGHKAWQLARSPPEPPAKSPAKSPPRYHGERHSSRKDREPNGPVSFQALPRHLQKFILDLEHRAEVAGDLDYWYNLARAREPLPDLLAKLSSEDVQILIRFYEDSDVDWQVYGHRLLQNRLYEAWGRLDWESATQYIAADLKRSLEKRAPKGELLNFDDPFLSHPQFGQWASIYEGWATKDSASALAAWEKFLSELEQEPKIIGTGVLDSTVRSFLTAGWARHAPAEALESALGQSDLNLQLSLTVGFDRGLTKDAPWSSLLDRILGDPHEAVVPYLDELVGHWASYDPQAALAWASQNTPHDSTPNLRVIRRWFESDMSDRAVTWLRDNAAELPEADRVEAIRSALAFQQHRLSEVLPIVATLPPGEGSWQLLHTLANVPPKFEFSGILLNDIDAQIPTLDPPQLRSLMDELEAPPALRAEIETAIASRAQNEN